MARNAAISVQGTHDEAPIGTWNGFLDPTNKKYEVQTYRIPNSMVTLSYWTDSVPTLGLQNEIVADLPGVEKPPPVVDWLRLASTYRQIVQVPLFQVEETYLGSDENGWDADIYATA